MISFPFMSRDKRVKSAAGSRSPNRLEQQLFGLPTHKPAGQSVEIGFADWARSSRELKEGCEVQEDLEIDTLPAELMESFRL